MGQISVLGIGWKCGLEAFSQLLQTGSCSLPAKHTDEDATKENWAQPPGILHPFAHLLIQDSWGAYSGRSPVVGAGGDIKRYSAFQIG